MRRLPLAAPDVMLMPWTAHAWWDAVGGSGLRARFVGQVDFLQAAVAASAAARGDSRTNLDLDGFLMPAAAEAAPLDRAAAAVLPRAISAATVRGARCISLHRHNCWPGPSAAEHTLPLRNRTARAPFPPAGASGGQPFLPKWLLRVPSAASVVVNQHEAWHAFACRRRFAAGGRTGADGPPSPSAADPAGTGAKAGPPVHDAHALGFYPPPSWRGRRALVRTTPRREQELSADAGAERPRPATPNRCRCTSFVATRSIGC